MEGLRPVKIVDPFMEDILGYCLELFQRDNCSHMLIELLDGTITDAPCYKVQFTDRV